LLGIKVIKLNKIKETPTVGAQIARRSNPARASFQRWKLPATDSNQNLPNRNLAASPSASEPPKSPLKSVAKKSACA
jgi:hypothetical protein